MYLNKLSTMTQVLQVNSFASAETLDWHASYVSQDLDKFVTKT